MTPYAGNAAVYPTTISLIDDSDTPDAANFDAAPQALADRTAYIRANYLALAGGTITGNVQVATGANISFQSGALLLIDPGAQLNVQGTENIDTNGTLNFVAGATLSGTISQGLVHLGGVELELDNLGSIVANHNQSIQAAQPGSIAPTVAQGIASGIANGIVATVAGGIAPTVAGGISDGGVAGGIQVTAADGLQVLGGASLDVENLGVLFIRSGGAMDVLSGGAIFLANGAVEEVAAGGLIQVDAGGSIAVAGTVAVASGGEVDIQAGSHGVQVAANTQTPVYASPATAATTTTLTGTPAGQTSTVVSTVKSNGSGVGLIAIPTANDAITHVDILVGFSDTTGSARGLSRFQCSAVNVAGTITNTSGSDIIQADQASILNLLFGGSPPVQAGIGGFGGTSPAYNIVATVSGGTLQINFIGPAAHNILWTAQSTILVI
jgi:hypothetical protein